MTWRRRRTEPAPPPSPPSTTRTTCPYDGAPLLASGICSETGGYPYGTRCPFACPLCRRPLAWDGQCRACRGQRHPSDPPMAPGDQWEQYDDEGRPLGDGHHWILVASGPQPLTVQPMSRGSLGSAA
jgi:hypothetical protein